MKKFTVTQDGSLKDFTASVYPQGSFCLAALLRGRDVKINGARVGSDTKLKAGDEVVYYTTPKQEQKPSHTVVFEDENVYIADKASGVTSEGLYSELCGRGEFYAVHRLDTNTQGLMVYAKGKRAEEELLRAFKERTVTKIYHAVCKNSFVRQSGILRAYLVKDGARGEVKIFSSPQRGSSEIVTEYTVKEDRGDTALVEIILHTGKTHQIRAHTAFIGCPVLGDGKYGDSALNKKYAATRQRLVAKYIGFRFRGELSYLNGIVFESSFNV